MHKIWIGWCNNILINWSVWRLSYHMFHRWMFVFKGAFISVQSIVLHWTYCGIWKSSRGQERDQSNLSRKDSPSSTLISNSMYDGEKTRPKPHLYRPASDLVSFVMPTYRTVSEYGKAVPSLNLMLYLPFWAVSAVVWSRVSPFPHSPLQKIFLFPDK